MPLYEYQCDACGRRFEMIQKISDPAAETCPSCGGSVHKLMSAPAFQFKGSGWYITDYARKEQPGAKKTDAESKDTEKPAGDKTDKGADASKGAGATDPGTASAGPAKTT